MTDRQTEIETFLTEAGWSKAKRTPLAGDMSARRYTRLTHSNGQTAVLMDAHPDKDTSTPAFLSMTTWLRDHGFSAPEVLYAKATQGLVLLEDLGDETFTSRIQTAPETQADLCKSAIDVLIALRQTSPPDLPKPNAADLTQWTSLADTIPGANQDALRRFRLELETVLSEALQRPATLSMRDFHADNLLWLPNRTGIQRVGLLDYQDAFLTHPIYDLVSLLTDARTEVSRELRVAMLSRYMTLTGDSEASTALAFASLSAQRNLRILALFSRNSAKAPLIPRVRSYLLEAVDHTVFDDARPHLIAGLPK